MDHSSSRRSATRTARPPDLMTALFALAAALLLLFILLPLLSIALSTSRQSLLATITDPEVLASLALTIATGAIATLLALLLGVPLAYLLARREFSGKAVVEGIIDVPVVIPHTAAGVALLLVFGRFGTIGQVTTPLGLSFTGSAAGIVVAMLFVSVPFLVNNAREAFALIEPEMESVALTEGASRWHRRVDDLGSGHERVRSRGHPGLQPQNRARVDLRTLRGLWVAGRAALGAADDRGYAGHLHPAARADAQTTRDEQPELSLLPLAVGCSTQRGAALRCASLCFLAVFGSDLAA